MSGLLSVRGGIVVYNILKLSCAFVSFFGIFTTSFAASFDKVRIGFVTTLTTSAGVVGQDMRDAADLALSHLGNEMAGIPVEILYEDDQARPEIGKQVTDMLVRRRDVDFVTGFIWSHVLLAARKSVLDAGKFLISANAGPSQLAGRSCHENLFVVSWQGDQAPMALGAALNKAGVETVYMMAPNYTAGKDMVRGFERVFKGRILGKDLTRWGADPQLDFSAEFAKVRSSDADALWAFYPSRASIPFLTQYEQAGLNDHIPLYSVYTLDSISLPRLQKAGLKSVLGSVFPGFWDPAIDNPANKAFVADFRSRYGRTPSHYAAQSYDAIRLIGRAVSAVDGDLNDKDGLRAAMRSADFSSVRGAFSFGHNHFPIQNFYLRKVVVGENGEWSTALVDVLLENHQDPYADDCSMQNSR